MKPLKPFETYKIDAQFKAGVSYGLHEGWDMNGLGGGNTDCGTPYKAAHDGEIVYANSSTKGYGNLVILKVKTVKGDRWVRYCHCDQMPVKSGLVKRGDIVATMGSSGNSTACHLHLDILKKEPANWRYYGTTDFDTYFEDPNIFFDTDVTINTEMPDYIGPVLRDNLGVNIQATEGEFRGQVGAVKDSVSRYEATAKELREVREYKNELEGELTRIKGTLKDSEDDVFRLATELRDGLTAIGERDAAITTQAKAIEALQQANKELQDKTTGNIKAFTVGELITEALSRLIPTWHKR